MRNAGEVEAVARAILTDRLVGMMNVSARVEYAFQRQDAAYYNLLSEARAAIAALDAYRSRAGGIADGGRP